VGGFGGGGSGPGPVLNMFCLGADAGCARSLLVGEFDRAVRFWGPCQLNGGLPCRGSSFTAF
jgi:hypothetical protein